MLQCTKMSQIAGLSFDAHLCYASAKERPLQRMSLRYCGEALLEYKNEPITF